MVGDAFSIGYRRLTTGAIGVARCTATGCTRCTGCTGCTGCTTNGVQGCAGVRLHFAPPCVKIPSLI